MLYNIIAYRLLPKRLDSKNRLKVSQLKIKTKIYKTIEGLIIIFIKLWFFNQLYQDFKSLRILISNLDVK